MKKNFFDFIHKETSFKEARRFNEVLFTNAANSIENIAKNKKKVNNLSLTKYIY